MGSDFLNIHGFFHNVFGNSVDETVSEVCKVINPHTLKTGRPLCDAPFIADWPNNNVGMRLSRHNQHCIMLPGLLVNNHRSYTPDVFWKESYINIYACECGFRYNDRSVIGIQSKFDESRTQ